jgi:hypothetical protein
MNRARLLARARKRRVDTRPVGASLRGNDRSGSNSSGVDVANGSGGGGGGGGEEEEEEAAEDPEIFDDLDFYTAQLEKVMLEGGALGEGNAEVEAAVMSGAGGS